MKKKENDSLPDIQPQPYKAPELRVIELATDEVLGVGCKTVTDFVPGAVCGTSLCGNQVGS